jgi:TonB family protein
MDVIPEIRSALRAFGRTGELMTTTQAFARYRIRRADGAERSIPSTDALARGIAIGEVLPDTLLFDSGTGTWGPARDASVVKFVLDELRREWQAPIRGWDDGAAEARPAPAPTAIVAQTASQRDSGSRGGTRRVVPAFSGRGSLVAGFLLVATAAAVGSVLLVVRGPADAKEERPLALATVAYAEPVTIPEQHPTGGPEDAAVDSPAAATSVESPASTEPEDSAVLAMSSEARPAERQPQIPPAPAPVTIDVPIVTAELTAEQTTFVNIPIDFLPPPSAAPPANPADAPIRLPFDVAPQIRNLDRVRQALRREYPPRLWESGVGGRVEMWFYVNENGVVERFQINQGSGSRQIDEAALRVAREFEFIPARYRGERVAVWILQGISFQR